MPRKAHSETAPPPPAVPAPAGDEGELPEGWAVATLGECSELNPRHPNTIDDATSVTFVAMPSVRESSPDVDASTVRPLSEVRKGYTHFADGDVLFAKITPCMENGKGAVAQRLANGMGCGSTELHVIRPRGAFDPYFAYRFLQQESVRRSAAENFTGSAGQLRVPTSFISELAIPLPPLAEQRRIVGVLEGLLGKVAASRERLARVPQLLKRFRQSVLAAACSGKLTADWREENLAEDARELVASLATLRESLWHSRTGGSVRRSYKPPFISERAQLDLPSTWQEVTVSQLALLDVGHAFKSAEFETEGIRLLRGENLEPGRLRWTDTRYWPKDKMNGLEHLLVEEGEIILALDRPVISTGLKIARATNADLPCALVQRMMRFKLVDERVTPWLFYNLNLPAFIEHLSAGLTGSDIPHVTGTGVAEYVVALPPLAEQHEIVRRVEQLFALADRLEAQLDAARKRVDRLTQSILGKAFRGELVPTEADLARREARSYEPASELLARIRDQPTTTKPAKAPRKTRQKSGE